MMLTSFLAEGQLYLIRLLTSYEGLTFTILSKGPKFGRSLLITFQLLPTFLELKDGLGDH